ncbi:Uncharacterized conserved protein [Ceraceosorus bombacis]|uniref:Uncharacterized conserved protein n=1 Tax=Ceraceosorus bombacis TaxID=401625 RepID=A0A0P1BFD4_9BASI|nr:Uncharacterized conserved protein [Ceraceosorus bombacis]
MPKLALQIRAQLSGVKELRPSTDDAQLVTTVKCTSCQEEHAKPVSFNVTGEVEVQGGRGVANFVMHCSFCKNQGSAKFDTPTSKVPLWQPYTGPDYARLTTLEFRGLEPVSFQADQMTWRCAGEESGTKFDDIALEDGEWTDYDEKTNNETSIMEVESKWVRA